MSDSGPITLRVHDFGPFCFLRDQFLRWLFSPLIAAFAVFLLTQAVIYDVAGAALVIFIELMCVGLVAGTWLRPRFAEFAFRGVAACVFAVFAILLADVWLSRSTHSFVHPLLGLLFLGLPLLCYAIFGKFIPLPKVKMGSVTFTDQAVTHKRPNGAIETVRWDDLLEVGILTTDEGPYLEDVFWVLLGPDEKSRCAVPQSADGSESLLRRLQQLPGFDNGAVIQAMTSVSNAAFVCWRRPAPAGT